MLRSSFLECELSGPLTWKRLPGGEAFSERLIDSTKRCLKRVIGSARLSYDELLTVIAEVETILNSRPLSYVSSDDLNAPLTPSHLLTGHRLISLPDPFISSEDPDYVATSAPNVLSRRMQHLTAILDHFWQRWKREYLTERRESNRFAHKKTATNPKPVSIGDIVLIQERDCRTGVVMLYWSIHVPTNYALHSLLSTSKPVYTTHAQTAMVVVCGKAAQSKMLTHCIRV